MKNRIASCIPFLLCMCFTQCEFSDTRVHVEISNIPFVGEAQILLKQMCNYYGSRSSFQSVQVALKNVKICLNRIDKLSIQIDTEKQGVESQRYKEIIQDFCQRKSEVKNCVEQLFMEIDVCLPDDKDSFISTFRSISTNVMDFMCNEESEFQEFLSNNGPRCVWHKQVNINQCREKILEHVKSLNIFDGQNDNRIVSSLSQIDVTFLDDLTNELNKSLTFQVHQCWIGNQLQQCILHELQECSTAVTTSVIHFFDLIKISTPCNKHTEIKRHASFNNDVGNKQSLDNEDKIMKTVGKSRDDWKLSFNELGNITDNEISLHDIGIFINESSVPNVKEGENILLAMCSRPGTEGTFETADMALRNVKDCFSAFIDFSKLPTEIADARLNGSLDEVFKDYCRKVDNMKSCVNKFLFDVDTCLADNEKVSKYTAQNISEAILQFVCDNEGDYIALFISEKGPQCIADKQPGIENCIKQNFNNSMSYEQFRETMDKNSSLSNSSTVLDEKKMNTAYEIYECRNVYDVQNCIIGELKKCSSSTPANVVESIFNLVRRSTVCHKYRRAQIDPNFSNGNHILTSVISLIIPILTILLSRPVSS